MGWSTRNLVFVPNQGISSPQHYARAVAQYWLKHYNISQHLRVYMPAWHTVVSCFKLSKRNIHYCAWKVFAENHKQCNTHWEYSLTTRCGDRFVRQRCQSRCCTWDGICGTFTSLGGHLTLHLWHFCNIRNMSGVVDWTTECFASSVRTEEVLPPWLPEENFCQSFVSNRSSHLSTQPVSVCLWGNVYKNNSSALFQL